MGHIFSLKGIVLYKPDATAHVRERGIVYRPFQACRATYHNLFTLL